MREELMADVEDNMMRMLEAGLESLALYISLRFY